VHGIIPKTLHLHPAENEYPGFFRAGEGESGEKEEWGSTSATTVLVQDGFLTYTSIYTLWPWDNLYL